MSGVHNKRCGNCKHWTGMHPSPGYVYEPPGVWGECRGFSHDVPSGDDKGFIACDDASLGPYLIVSQDFSCAHWAQDEIPF